jgi:hypothetical protein
MIVHIKKGEGRNLEESYSAIRTTITAERMKEEGLIEDIKITHQNDIMITMRATIIEIIEIISRKKAIEKIALLITKLIRDIINL